MRRSVYKMTWGLLLHHCTRNSIKQNKMSHIRNFVLNEWSKFVTRYYSSQFEGVKTFRSRDSRLVGEDWNQKQGDRNPWGSELSPVATGVEWVFYTSLCKWLTPHCVTYSHLPLHLIHSYTTLAPPSHPYLTPHFPSNTYTTPHSFTNTTVRNSHLTPHLPTLTHSHYHLTTQLFAHVRKSRFPLDLRD